ncbi:pantoate--beta-alanine ligase [Shimia sp. R11_0]|uniref:pantoate--beta-alanine ligase n=1 Tax=Shimia sp. R11_0 TaxID=2821096 RepID=UPI001AD9FF91|nr:pantoate--beta-alanine ligase [Shimia sp. R11_0]MBO9476648.1 pantoate--beta-alanine ligase [Shimia sp. R11_0]
MLICRSVSECRDAVAALRKQGKTIGMVPTMGFLHAGHMSLIETAQSQAEAVVVSIFVNPTQFGESADLEAYPRNESGDLAMLREAGVDVVFLPEVDTMYPPGDETIVETTHLANVLHGAVRPGHFRGVTTVVARLFNIVQPDTAVFGEKDYQQLQVIKRMVADLHMPVTIIGAPTVREADGLAMSSRNVRLSTEDRVAALVLSRALDAAQASTATGTTVATLSKIITDTIAAEPRASLKGLDIVAAESLTVIDGPLTGPTAIMISVAFGDILLIDQRVVTP